MARRHSLLLEIFAVCLIFLRSDAKSLSQCPDALASQSGGCQTCPQPKDLEIVRQGVFPGVVPGRLIPHASYGLNQTTTRILGYNPSLVQNVSISSCCSLCSYDSNCRYWSWRQFFAAETSSKGFCSLFNVDQCSFSNSTQYEDFDSSDKLSFSSQKCAKAEISQQASSTLSMFPCLSSPGQPDYYQNISNLYSFDLSNSWSGDNISSNIDSTGIKVVTFQSSANILDTDGPQNNLYDLPVGSYKLSGWVMVQSATGNSSFIMIGMHYPGQSPKTSSIVSTGIAKDGCWTKFTGGFTLRNTQSVVFRVMGTPPSSELLLASFSLERVDPLVYLRGLNDVIYQIRQRDVSLYLFDAAKGDSRTLFIELDQIKPDFPFGAASAGSILVSEEYQRWFRKRFTHTVYQNEAKWYYQEGAQGQFNYADADNMTALFHSMGIQIRGHNILWDVPNYVQGWVKNLSNADLRTAIEQRIESVVTRYNGSFIHWDVINEMLHGHYYEDRLRDGSFASSVFRKVKALNPMAKTFLNDYNVVETMEDSRASPEMYIENSNRIEANGGIVNGFGVQGHFSDANGPRLRSELDALAQAGKPIWFTELDVAENDSDVQADKFETIMREAFSHPAVEGIMLWEAVRPNCLVTPWSYIDPSICKTECTKCLTDGFFNDRPVGKRYVRLRKEWSTHRNVYVSEGKPFVFHGFFGDYRLRVTDNGTVSLYYFQVPKGRDQLDITINLANYISSSSAI